MPVPTAYRPAGHGPSCWDKIKLGFMMGAAVGAGSGLLFGGFSIWRLGLRGRDAWYTLGRTIGASGGTFGLFMAVGSGIRC